MPHSLFRRCQLPCLIGALAIMASSLTALPAAAAVVSQSSTIGAWSLQTNATLSVGEISFKYLGRMGASNNWLRTAGDSTGVSAIYNSGTSPNPADDLYEFDLLGPIYGNANWSTKYLFYQVTLTNPKLRFSSVSMNIQGNLTTKSSIVIQNTLSSQYLSPTMSQSAANSLLGVLRESRTGAGMVQTAASQTTLSLNGYQGNSIYVMMEINVLSPFSLKGPKASLTDASLTLDVIPSVPEPSSCFLMTGLLGAGLLLVRRNKSKTVS